MKKAFYEYLDLVKTNSLIYNTLKFDQYSRFAISLHIFWFSTKNSKTNLKFEKSFSLVCRTRHDEFIDV